MENFLLSILSQVVATGICCTFRYIYKKVKNHSNGWTAPQMLDNIFNILAPTGGVF